MAIRRSNILIALAFLAAPATAQEVGDMSHSDFITTGAGEAPQANVVIQTPTPWPRYINSFDYLTDGTNSELVMQKLKLRNAKQETPSTVINIGVPLK